jgi:hypothetical protein
LPKQRKSLRRPPLVHRDHADLRMRALDPGEISPYLVEGRGCR